MTATSAEIFLHVRVIMGIILGLGMARLLTGLARFVQHPERRKAYWVHLAWAVSILLTLVHFWWWEFRLIQIGQWTFEIYLFVITYAIVLYLICTLLFPDNIQEYAGYEDYFISRRAWFFGLLGLTFLFDLIDTLLKGWEHFQSFGMEYTLRVPVYVVLCILAIMISDRRFHAAFVAVNLIYQVSWILRQFDTLS